MSSTMIQDFFISKNIEGIITSPHNPVSNGKGESEVKLVKSLLYKSKNDAMAFSEALLVYHYMPIDPNLLMPSQLMNSHRILSDIPYVETNERDTYLADHRARYKARYLKDVEVPKYQLSDLVWVQDPINKHWQAGKISGITDKPDSYFITLNSNMKA